MSESFGGFSAAVEDPSGNAWLLGYFGSVVFLPVGSTPSSFALPAGDVFVGAAYTQSQPYFLRSNGDVFTISGGVVTQITGTYAEEASSLSSDAGHLYAALPGSAHLGILTFSSPTSGTVTKVATPQTVPAILSASASGVAIAGWDYGVLASGAVAIAVNPATSAAAAVNTTTDKVMLLTGSDPDWQLTSAITGTGSPVDVTWASSGEQVLVTDTTGNAVEVYDFAADVLTPTQSISCTGCSRLAVTPDGLTVGVVRPANNAVQFLINTTNVWSNSTLVAISTNPTCIADISETEMVIGYQAGSGGGVQWLESTVGVWGLGAVVTGLAYIPSRLTIDDSGNIHVVGSASGVGYLTIVSKTGVIASITWSGSGDDVLWEQGQTLVLDITNSRIRAFSLVAGSLLAAGTLASTANDLGITGETIWLMGTSQSLMYRLTAPFHLAPILSGHLAVYSGGTWIGNTVLGIEHPPSSVTWDVSGNVWVATEDNLLYSVAASGAVLSQSTVPPFPGQTAEALLGLTALTWYRDNHLYAASSLNGLLGQLL